MENYEFVVSQLNKLAKDLDSTENSDKFIDLQIVDTAKIAKTYNI